jgi:2-oxoglutarate dehydrogenase E2 component (dihydrolipoamide succinyltransferase)
MALDVKIPAVGESITSGLISTWHKNDGDAITSGEALLTLETDKVSTEITAESAGVLRIKVPAGQEVKIGQVVASIEEGGGGGQSAPAATAIAPVVTEAPAPAHTMVTPQIPAAPHAETPRDQAPAEAPSSPPSAAPTISSAVAQHAPETFRSSRAPPQS